jgi:hypothetical protein
MKMLYFSMSPDFRNSSPLVVLSSHFAIFFTSVKITIGDKFDYEELVL